MGRTELADDQTADHSVEDKSNMSEVESNNVDDSEKSSCTGMCEETQQSKQGLHKLIH